jgi:hypothetical protein
MPGSLIVGRSNNGKTTLVEYFRDKTNPPEDPEAECSRFPVVLIEAPPTPTETGIYRYLLEAVRVPASTQRGPESLFIQILSVFPALGVQMIICEEIHNTLACSGKQQRRALNTLKFLTNRLGISLVLTGTRDAFNALEVDDQSATRFPPVWLPQWKLGQEYKRLLLSIERFLPLRNPSYISQQPELMNSILTMSDGTIGGICDLVNAAAEVAIRDQSEAITPSTLKKIKWIPLREGRKHAMTAL